MNREEIFRLINAERERQNVKHPSEQAFLSKPLAILVEEVGEVAKSINEDDSNLQEEIVQVAAVCVRWLENMGPSTRHLTAPEILNKNVKAITQDQVAKLKRWRQMQIRDLTDEQFWDWFDSTGYTIIK